MMPKLLVVEPLEPLTLSRAPIASPQHLGARVSLFHAPQPTTVLGAVGRALNVTVGRGLDVEKLEDVKTAADAVSERLACSEPILMGPLLTSRDLSEVYVPLGRSLHVSTRLLERVLKQERETLYTDLDPCYSGPGACVESSTHLPLTGIALERRGHEGQKVVRLGYMFRYSVAIYRDVLTGAPQQLSTVYVLNCGIDLNDVVRVGGEGRVARVYTKTELPRDLNNLSSPATRLEPGIYLSVSYVPLVPKIKNALSLRLSDFCGLEFLESEDDVIGVPQSGGSPPKVRVERLGLGFSESQGKRRPQLLALPPATLVRVRSPRERLKSVEIVETLWTIGYSSLYKIQR